MLVLRSLVVGAVLAVIALGVWWCGVYRLEGAEEAASASIANQAGVVLLPDSSGLPYRVDRVEKDIERLQSEDKAIHQEIKELRESVQTQYNRLAWLLIGNLAAVVTALGSSLLRRVRRTDGIILETPGGKDKE